MEGSQADQFLKPDTTIRNDLHDIDSFTLFSKFNQAALNFKELNYTLAVERWSITN